MKNSKQQTANSKQQTANSKQQTANSKQQTANSKQQTANSKQQTVVALSFIINIIFIISFCFIAYAKRHSIVNYAEKFYEAIFNENKNFENSILVFNQDSYQTDIKYINENKFGKKIKIAILGNSISLHGIVDGLWE